MIKEHEIGIRFSMFLYFFTFDNNDIKYGENRTESAICLRINLYAKYRFKL